MHHRQDAVGSAAQRHALTAPASAGIKRSPSTWVLQPAHRFVSFGHLLTGRHGYCAENVMRSFIKPHVRPGLGRCTRRAARRFPLHGR